MAETARDVIARIRRKRREQDYCLAVLDLWAQVQGQGIEVSRVASFGFDSRIFDAEARVEIPPELRQVHRDLAHGRRTGPRLDTYVRHHDGGMTRLDPMLQAVYEPETEEKLLGKAG